MSLNSIPIVYYSPVAITSIYKRS